MVTVCGTGFVLTVCGNGLWKPVGNAAGACTALLAADAACIVPNCQDCLRQKSASYLRGVYRRRVLSFTGASPHVHSHSVSWTEQLWLEHGVVSSEPALTDRIFPFCDRNHSPKVECTFVPLKRKESVTAFDPDCAFDVESTAGCSGLVVFLF